jgi:O-antigen/teichoic acid export membrane protein
MRELLKATLKTASGSAGNLLMGVISMKIMAIILGPSGVGLYSLLRQTIEFSKGVGTVGGETALVQGLASREGQERSNYLVTTFWTFVLGTLLMTTLLTVSAPWISLWVFERHDEHTINLVRWLALPVALWVASTYLNGVLNGFRAIGMLALIQALGAAAATLLAYPVSRLVDVGYASAFIVMVSAPPAVGVLLGAWSALRAGWLGPLFRSPLMSFHPDSLRHFFSIAGTMLFTQILTEGTVLAVRALIVRHGGLAGAGIFAVAWTLSLTYMMLILTSFGTYYLPTLSQTSDPGDRVVLMRRVIRLSTLLMVPLVTSVIVLKPLVINVLYSGEFVASLEIIRWMLIGDYFKVIAWVIAMPVLAYADMKVFLWMELLWNAGFLTFSALSLFNFGSVQGIGVSFLLMYVAYLAFYWHYVRSRYGLSLTRPIVGSWLLGLVLVVGASWYSWSDTRVDWLAAFLWIGMAATFSCLSLKRSEWRGILSIALKRKEAWP